MSFKADIFGKDTANIKTAAPLSPDHETPYSIVTNYDERVAVQNLNERNMHATHQNVI